MGPAATERITKDPIGYESINPEIDTSEYEFEPWGDKQRLLVEANQDVIVPCPWMDGEEVTLSTAMNTYPYPPNLTAEDEPFLIAVVEELLANRVDREEPEEITEADELALDLEEAEEEVTESEAVQGEERERKSDDTSSGDRPSRAKEPTARVVAKEEQSRQADAIEDRPPEIPRVSKDESLPTIPIPVATTDVQVVAPERPKEALRVVTVEVPEDDDNLVPRIVENDRMPQAIEVLEIPRQPVGPEVLVPEPSNPEEIQEFQVPEDFSLPPIEASALPQPVNLAVKIENLTLFAKDLAVSIDQIATDTVEVELAPIETAPAARADAVRYLDGEEGGARQPTIPQPLPESFVSETQKGGETVVIEPEEEPQIGVDREVDQPVERLIEGLVLTEISTVPEAKRPEPRKPQDAETADDYIDIIIKRAAAIEQLRDEGITDEAEEVFEEVVEFRVERFDEIELTHALKRDDQPSSRPLRRRRIEVSTSTEELEDQESESSGIGVLKRPAQGFVVTDDLYHDRLISRIALELCGFKISFSLN